MAVDLVIRAKGFLANDTLDFVAMLKDLRLSYGNYNEFFILEENIGSDQGLLYNPQRMARGIVFNGSQMNQGKVSLSFNLPTSPREIHDFFAIVQEIKKQYRNIELELEGKPCTLEDFMGKVQYYQDCSLSTLRGFCQNKEYEAAILTLASFPYTLSPDEMDYFATEGSLEEFETLLHHKQQVEAQYSCPKIMENSQTGELVAFYTLVEGCPCILPTDYRNFLSPQQQEVSAGYLRFYLDSVKKVMEGYYDYQVFVSVMVDFGAEYFDGDHLYLPGFRLAELKEIALEIRQRSQASKA